MTDALLHTFWGGGGGMGGVLEGSIQIASAPPPPPPQRKKSLLPPQNEIFCTVSYHVVDFSLHRRVNFTRPKHEAKASIHVLHARKLITEPQLTCMFSNCLWATLLWMK